MRFHERVKDAALDVGLGRKYGHTGNASQNCVRLWYAILFILFGSIVGTKSDEIHLNIRNGLGSFANLEALVELGLAEWILAPGAGDVCLGQGWRRDDDGDLVGHLFGMLERDILGEWWILESTNGTPDWYRPEDPDDRAARYTVGVRWIRLRPEKVAA